MRQMFALIDGVEEMPDCKQDEISDKLEEFGKRQQSEAEPQTEHSTKVRYVLCHLYTVSPITIKTLEMFKYLCIMTMRTDKIFVNPIMKLLNH